MQSIFISEEQSQILACRMHMWLPNHEGKGTAPAQTSGCFGREAESEGVGGAGILRKAVTVLEVTVFLTWVTPSRLACLTMHHHSTLICPVAFSLSFGLIT